jgi:hypothetical protein
MIYSTVDHNPIFLTAQWTVQKEPDKILKTYLGTMICSHGKTHNSDTIVRYK